MRVQEKQRKRMVRNLLTSPIRGDRRHCITVKFQSGTPGQAVTLFSCLLANINFYFSCNCNFSSTFYFLFFLIFLYNCIFLNLHMNAIFFFSFAAVTNCCFHLKFKSFSRSHASLYMIGILVFYFDHSTLN